MRTVFLVLFGFAVAMVADNQYTAMVGDYSTATLGWVGFGLPFGIALLAFGLGYTLARD